MQHLRPFYGHFGHFQLSFQKKQQQKRINFDQLLHSWMRLDKQMDNTTFSNIFIIVLPCGRSMATKCWLGIKHKFFICIWKFCNRIKKKCVGLCLISTPTKTPQKLVPEKTQRVCHFVLKQPIQSHFPYNLQRQFCLSDTVQLQPNGIIDIEQMEAIKLKKKRIKFLSLHVSGTWQQSFLTWHKTGMNQLQK